MKFFTIFFILVVVGLAVAAGEARDGICNSQKTPTKLIARRTWPGQIAPTTARTTATATTTMVTFHGNIHVPPTTSTDTTTKVATTSTQTSPTTSSPILFTCSVIDPDCGNMCGDVTSTTTGVVQSPNFPGDYGYGSKQCGVEITVPGGGMIQLNFTTFDVETDVCIVVVGDRNILLWQTGNKIPSVVNTTTNRMYIGLDCSGSTKPTSAVYNWQATFSVTSQERSCIIYNSAGCENMCTNVSSTGTGVVQSPNFPGDYGNEYRNCRVIIIVPAGKRIQLEFTTFNLETGKSEISVYDRKTTYLAGVTGNTIPAVFTTTSRTVDLVFGAYGSSKPNTAIYNWQATYTAV